jgi:hypothetical protein
LEDDLEAHVESRSEDGYGDRQHTERDLHVSLWLAKYSLSDRIPESHQGHGRKQQACWEPAQAAFQWSATLLREHQLPRMDNGTIRLDQLMKTSEFPPGALQMCLKMNLFFAMR